jgi:hypothetical protein
MRPSDGRRPFLKKMARQFLRFKRLKGGAGAC